MKKWTFFFQKLSHSSEKCKRVDPLRFNNMHSVAKYQKIEGGPFDAIKQFSKKSLPNKIKNTKGGSLVCFRGSGRQFWFG